MPDLFRIKLQISTGLTRKFVTIAPSGDLWPVVLTNTGRPQRLHFITARCAMPYRRLHPGLDWEPCSTMCRLRFF